MSIDRKIAAQYTRSITRNHRAAYLLLLDLSGSMSDMVDFEGDHITKSAALTNICNKILRELYMRAIRNGEVCDYYDIAILRYSNGRVVSLLNDDVRSPFVSITTLERGCRGHEWFRVESFDAFDSDDTLRDMQCSAVAIESAGSTPMLEGLYVSQYALSEWCERPENYDSPSPVLFHISDGHPTDCSLAAVVDASHRIKSLGTNDGGVLFLNIQLECEGHSCHMLFPTDDEIATIPSRFAQMMGHMSSIMPDTFEPMIHELRESRSEGGYRGVGYNLSVSDVISMMSIGTLSSMVR